MFGLETPCLLKPVSWTFTKLILPPSLEEARNRSQLSDSLREIIRRLEASNYDLPVRAALPTL